MLELYREGTPWWVSAPLVTASPSVDIDLVIPRPSNRGAMISGTGDRNLEEYRLILLGFHYSFTAANGNGFDLEWTDNQVTPALARTIIAPRASTAITHVEGGSSFCFIPGPAGAYNPIENGATLRLNFTTTSPTDGRLLVWGIHVPADWSPGKLFTGSPVAF